MIEHQQVEIVVNGPELNDPMTIEVDVGASSIVKKMFKLGLHTLMSCERQEHRDNKMWLVIEFYDYYRLLDKLNRLDKQLSVGNPTKFAKFSKCYLPLFHGLSSPVTALMLTDYSATNVPIIDAHLLIDEDFVQNFEFMLDLLIENN